MTGPTGPFRINWVAENTGVAEATLRAWERRYQVPKPSRTPSGYRIYSQEDVEQIQRMRELCEAGLAPADAAQLILRDPSSVSSSSTEESRASVQSSVPASALGVVQTSEAIGSKQTNVAGVLSLSSAVEIMERAACLTVAHTLRRTAIVVSCSGVDLLGPVALGQIVKITARLVPGQGETISVDVALEVENIETHQSQQIARSRVVLVPLDPQA